MNLIGLPERHSRSRLSVKFQYNLSHGHEIGNPLDQARLLRERDDGVSPDVQLLLTRRRVLAQAFVHDTIELEESEGNGQEKRHLGGARLRTMVQNNQESRRKYRATGLFVRSL